MDPIKLKAFALLTPGISSWIMAVALTPVHDKIMLKKAVNVMEYDPGGALWKTSLSFVALYIINAVCASITRLSHLGLDGVGLIQHSSSISV